MTLPARDDGGTTGGVIAADEAIVGAERTEGDGVGDGAGIDKLRLSGRAADVPIECGFSPGASNFSLASNSGGGLEVDGGRETEEIREDNLFRRMDCLNYMYHMLHIFFSTFTFVRGLRNVFKTNCSM